MESRSPSSNTPSPSAAERGDEKCCALVADCDCYRCQAAKGEPSLLDQMTEARNELLRDIQQNLLPQIKAQAAELSRIRTLLDREKLANLIYQYLFPCPGGAPRLNSYELADKLRSSLLGSGPEGEER